MTQIRQWFGTVGWFVQLLGGCFRQESDYPTFFISWQSLIDYSIGLNLATDLCLSWPKVLKVWESVRLS